ncbi:MAG TPA: hypothetical protein VNC11_15725 [Gemmatimonadaceae bacterium]|jgi:hypothetical protein|nr:hypothetical protein [Gemmatimonadaceae bacterium]
MTDGVAPFRRYRWWTRIVMVLVICIAAPVTPQLRALLPIEQTLMLLTSLIAACMIVGWRQGGSPWRALFWVTLAIIMVAYQKPPSVASIGLIERGFAFESNNPYAALARGWTLLLAAAFGLVSVFSPAQSFISRALSTLAIAAGLGFVLVLISPGGPARISTTMATEYTRRVDESMAQLRNAASAARPRGEVSAEDADRWNQMVEDQTLDISRSSAPLVPALLALESLAAMAVAWSLYHRLNPRPIGPALSRLRDFRFNDQLVWGVAVGASIAIVPAFSEAKNAGYNLLVFFGALYVLRGLGILGWISNGRVIRLFLAVAAWTLVVGIIAYKLGFLIALGAPLIALAFSLGLGDTWVDWRRLLQPKVV